MNHFFNYLIANLKLGMIQTMQLLLFWNKVTFGYLYFFFNRISTQFNYLQTITQSRLNVLNVICRGNKQNFAKVIFQFKIVIVKTVVLFRIEHFKQSRGRIATKIISYFINFVKYHYWI